MQRKKKMTLYTSITEEEYKILKQNGVLRCDETKASMPNEYMLWKIAYNFMSAQLEKQSIKPKGTIYPRWAWYTINGKRNVLESNPIHFVSAANETAYVLTVNINNERVLLSDFDLWHCCLNGYGIFESSDEDDDFNSFLDICKLTYFDVLTEQKNSSIIYIQNEIFKTWEKIFNLHNSNSYYSYKQKTIQGVFWELYVDDVIDSKKICLSCDEYERLSNCYD